MKTDVYQYCLHLPVAGGHRWSKGDIKLLGKLYPKAITQELPAPARLGGHRWPSGLDVLQALRK